MTTESGQHADLRSSFCCPSAYQLLRQTVENDLVDIGLTVFCGNDWQPKRVLPFVPKIDRIIYMTLILKVLHFTGDKVIDFIEMDSCSYILLLMIWIKIVQNLNLVILSRWMPTSEASFE